MSTKRIAEFDVFRALAMLCIVGVWHIDDYGSPRNILLGPFSMFFSYCALGLFVFVSGSLLSARYGGMACASDVWEFYKRRFLRIWPMYALTLIAYLALRMIDWPTFLMGALLLDVILAKPLPTLWFVAMMFVFYVVSPLLLYKFSPRRAVTVAATVFGLLMLLHTCIHEIDMNLFWYFPTYLAGVLYGRSRRLGHPDRPLGWVISAAVLSVSLVWFSLSESKASILAACTLGALSSAAVCRPLARTIVRRDSLGIIEMLSYSSFAIYLTHRIVFAAVVHVWHPSGAWAMIAYLWLIGIPLTVLASYAFQALYDYCLDCLRWTSNPGNLQPEGATEN